jgi:hypothetical protein
VEQMQLYMNVRLKAFVDHDAQFACQDGMGDDTSDLEGLFV